MNENEFEKISNQDDKESKDLTRIMKILHLVGDLKLDYSLEILSYKGMMIGGCDIFLTEEEFIINLQEHIKKYDLKIDYKLLRRMEKYGFIPQGGLLDDSCDLFPILKPIDINSDHFNKSDMELVFKRYSNILDYYKRGNLVFKGPIELAGIAPNQISLMFVEKNKKRYPNRIYLYRQISEFERFHFLAGNRFLRGDSYFEEKISELKDIVNSDNTNESTLQTFLESNFWIWGFEYSQAIPKQQLGEKYQIDFLLMRIDGVSEIVELERSNLKLFTKKMDLTKELTLALRQVRDYQSYCLRNYNYLSSESKVDIFAPKGHVIIGNNISMTEIEKLRELNNSLSNIEVYTYDFLITKAESFVSNLNKMLAL